MLMTEGNTAPLEYVCSEFAKTCLYYPYHIEGEKQVEGLEHHDHYFVGVLSALLHNPELFSVRGFEEYYAKHEIEFFDKVQKRLLEMKERNDAKAL